MQKRIIKSTNTEISALGFGAMRLPTQGGHINHDEALKLINHAIDNGINYIDTAYFYHNGESETFLKEVLSKRRDEVFISTKLPVMFVNKKEDLRKYLNLQLERLGVDHIDFYYLHALNIEKFEQLKEFGIFEFFDEIKAEGLVRHVGFSYHDNYEPFKTIIDSYPWDMCLLQYNFIDTNTQAGYKGVRYAYDHGVSVFIMEPLKGGLLANNVPGEIQNIMNQENITDTPASWALKWLLNHEEITCILSGMNKISDVDENINTTNDTMINSISESKLDVYSKVKKVYDDLIKIPCTACGYCMPCPYGVDIPTCFKTYNNKHIFNKNSHEYMMMLSGITGSKASYASKCRNCRICLSKCPQHIQIPRTLREVSKDMEFPGFKYILWFVSNIGKPIYNFYISRK